MADRDARSADPVASIYNARWVIGSALPPSALSQTLNRIVSRNGGLKMPNATAAWRWCSSRLSRRRGDDRGAVLVIVALLLPLIMGTAALVIDVGFWYLTQAQLQAAADAAALAGAQQLPSSPSSAQAYAQSLAAKNVSGATVTPVTPYNGSSSEIKVTVSEPGPIWFGSVIGISAPTITASAIAENTAGTGSFIYAASTACNAISIVNSGNLSVSTTVWSNGGVSAVSSGTVTVTGQVDVGNSSCSFPGSLTPPGPTSVGTNAGWPVALPTTGQGNLPSSCSTASISIVGSGWLSSNPPGMYCTTGTITIVNSGSVNVDGYEFVSESSSSNAINVINSGSGSFYGYCPGDPGAWSSCPAGGAPQTLFYATAGGISFVNSGGASFMGDVFAPAGQASLTMSGGTGTNGFLEASTMSFTNSGYTSVTGSGPTSSGGVSLIG
jgi:Flp pilus assembly protein TadG